MRADPGQLEQVILNLAANARDAMPNGGALFLRTSDIDAQTCQRVTDTGTGMPPEVLARVFEPLFTTKGAGTGTGLGLAVVDGIVRQSGGSIRVESSAAGTTFEIMLPLIHAEATATTTTTTTTTTIKRKSTILLIEDETQVRAVIARLLERAGYTVLPAMDGVDALELAAHHPGAIDLVVSDHIMPRMNGPEAVNELRKLRRGLPVLFISGYTGGPLNDVALLGPRSRFLQKPFQNDELLMVAQELLSDRPEGEHGNGKTEAVDEVGSR